ncbi:hypothetical protein ACH5RR_006546 [Cinchona calisaya]|uniref:Uncharacterized protein n=1 Tax=Cinchona calisaya TaxID=153742 RepID=A0ABD3APA9_9GENT
MPKVSKEQVEKLKKTANNQRTFSRYEVVSAHLWKCISMARGLKPEQETVLYVHVDFRNRLKPPMPQNYFGNGVIAVPVRAIVGDIVSKSLGLVSSKIREAMENVKDEYVKSYLVCLKNVQDVSSSRPFYTVGSSQGLFFGNPNLTIIS